MPRGLRGAAWLLFGLLVACAGAASRRPAAAPPDEVAREYYRLAQRQLWQGRDSAALALFDAALHRAPCFVAAHRERQNLLLAELRRGELLQEYGRLRARHPDQAWAIYLHGRLFSAPERQVEAFQEALALDPRSPWARLGLGHRALSAGDVEGGREAFLEGLTHAPGQRDLRLGLAQALLLEQRFGEAALLLRVDEVLAAEDDRRLQLLAELHRLDPPRRGGALQVLGVALARAPEHRGHAEQVLGYFLEEGTRQDALWLSRLLGPCIPGDTQEMLRLRMAVAESVGDPFAALVAARRLEAPTLDEHRRRRALLAQVGGWREMVERDRPLLNALASIGHPAPAFAEVETLAARIADGLAGAGERRRFARSLRALGWADVAAISLRDAFLAVGGLDPELLALALDLRTQARLESEVEIVTQQSYRDFASEGELGDFEDFLEGLAALSRRIVGRDLVAGSTLYEFGPLGTLLDPDPAEGGPWARYFAERGRMVIAGRRAFHPPELLLVPTLAWGRAGPQSAALAFCEGWIVPSLLHHLGAPIAGAALHRFVYVDAGSIAAETRAMEARRHRLHELRPSLLADPPEPARSQRARRSLQEPGEVTRKLELRAHQDWVERGRPGGPDGFLAEAVEEVLVHETAHLVDAEEFFSSTVPWLRAIPPLIINGFSPARVEAWLEMRAQCAALAAGANPYLALSSCTEYMPLSRSPDSPHAAGYAQLLERLVERIDEHPEDFPALDFQANLLQQLDRLEAGQIRGLAQEVLGDLGM